MNKLGQTRLFDQTSRPKDRGRLFLTTTLLVIVALVGVIGCELSNQPLQNTLTQNIQSSPQPSPRTSQQKLSPESWMVQGMYAVYKGQISNFSAPVKIFGKIQVIDLNASHVKIQTDMNMSTSFAPAIADRTIQWVNKTNIVFQPKGETLANKYETQITLAGLGDRSCTVYDYNNEAINATYYLDKTLQWPIKIVYTTAFENQIYQIEINLTDTNINGL